jgi:hypothetical protein
VEVYPQSVFACPPEIPVKVMGSISRGFLILVVGGCGGWAKLD